MPGPTRAGTTRPQLRTPTTNATHHRAPHHRVMSSAKRRPRRHARPIVFRQRVAPPQAPLPRRPSLAMLTSSPPRSTTPTGTTTPPTSSSLPLLLPSSRRRTPSMRDSSPPLAARLRRRHQKRHLTRPFLRLRPPAHPLAVLLAMLSGLVARAHHIRSPFSFGTMV
jgi:hypothetical protein